MIHATVHSALMLTPTVTRYRLTSRPGRAPLPPAVPGQHITMRVGPRLKTFTIVAVDDGAYQLAVRNRDLGSRRDVMSANLFAGASVTISAPSGTFTSDEFTHFLAAGVGVNPILAVLKRGQVRDWHLTYVDRGEQEFPFLQRLRELAWEQGGRVVTIDTATQRRPDWAAVLADIPAGSTIGACGPAAMISEVRAAFGLAPNQRSLVVDGPATTTEALPEAVEVVCAKSGTTFQASQYSSLLDQLNQHGVAVPSSCRQGICGTCEVEVRAGQVDHRDEVLTDEEKADTGYMLPCVSKPISRQLVLNV